MVLPQVLKDIGMKKMIKLGLMSIATMTVLGLTACQSNPPPVAENAMSAHKHDNFSNKNHPHDRKHGEKLSKEEHQQRKAELEQKIATHRAERDALNKACQTKVGTNISVKIGEKTFEGSCEVQFKPKPRDGQSTDKPEMLPFPPSPEDQLAPEPKI